MTRPRAVQHLEKYLEIKRAGITPGHKLFSAVIAKAASDYLRKRGSIKQVSAAHYFRGESFRYHCDLLEISPNDFLEVLRMSEGYVRDESA